MEKSKYTDLDDVLSKFNFFGRYHVELFFCLMLAYATNSMYSTNYIFAAENVELKCVEPFQNSSVFNASTCLEWTYTNPHTFVAEFQIGDQEWKRTLVGTIHSFGYMVGLLIVGPMSDRIGRKKTAVLTGVLGGVFGLAKSFSPWYWLYIAFEFVEAAFGDMCSPLYILNIEIVSTKRRVPYYLFCSLGFAFGSILLPLTAWTVPYWRNFLRAIYTPAFLFFFYMFLIDESPRWLLIKGRKEKALKILKDAADKNKIEFSKGELENLQCDAPSKGIGLFDLLKMTFTSPTMLKRCVICIIWWITCTFVNYGLVINAVSLQGNKYVNFMLMAVLEIPGNFIIMYILLYFKRKYPLMATFAIGGSLCIMQPFLPSNLPWLSLLVYIVGKQMSSFYFVITYMYTSELFPTYTRNSMHALCSSLGRIGSIIAPQTPLLMVYWTGLPSMIFGIVSLLAGLVTFLVPDTADDSLPDTVREAEKIGKSDAKTIEFT